MCLRKFRGSALLREPAEGIGKVACGPLDTIGGGLQRLNLVW